MISPQDLQYFLESAKAENLSRAAERLGISQPALTMALQRLEQTVGLELFHRSKKGVRLTKAGEMLQQEAKGLAEHWDKVHRNLHRSVEEIRGTYTLGCHPSVAIYSLPQSLPTLLADFPDLRLELQHDLSRKITEQVIRGEIDLAIVVNPVRHPDLVIKTLCKDEVGFWTSKEASKVNRLDSNSSVLICQPDLLQTQNLLRKMKAKFSRTLHSTNLEVIASLANAGSGIAILPGRVAAEWKNLKIIPEMPTFEDEVALLYRAENRRVAAFRELAKRLEQGML